MNASLPAGIESYLKEAGFTSTEMLVLRKLVEEDSLTIRELASKTGKSTGVLDQSMKKLLHKKIAQRNIVNGQPRYSIQSLDSIVKWVQHDMDEKKKVLERRHQNFESFIASLKVDRKRPDIEYFHGLEGIRQAYLKLLEQNQEFLTTSPILHLAEEDPLRDIRVELFRKRQARKIFQRVLAPDTPLSARFRSRDPFEYRRSLLLPEQELSLPFEKTVVGDLVACINVQEQSACLLKYPDLAKAERDAFNVLWTRSEALERGETANIVAATTPVPLKTRFFSSLREFLLSKKSIAAFVIFALLAGALTFGLYKNNRELNLRRMEEKVLAIANTGVLQIDAKDVEAVTKPEDIQKPEYARLIATLNLIRRNNEDIQYVYIMRPTSDPTKMAFVADADSLHPTEKRDLNDDGVINEADALNMPGELYDDDEFPKIREALKEPFADVGSDQWGTFVTGHAPIRDSSGNAIAILGVDMFVEKLDELSSRTFSPVYAFIILFIAFLLIRFFALNRSLAREWIKYVSLHKRKSLLWIAFSIPCLLSLFLWFRFYTNHLLIREAGEKLKSIAVSTADEFDPKELDQLRFARDMNTEAYQNVFAKLNDIRNRNPFITFAYIMRPLSEKHLFEFVADADSNFDLPTHSKYRIEDISAPSEADENVWPGFVYDEGLENVMTPAMKKPTYGGPYTDQWGTYVTGCAPIFIDRDALSAILCVDVQMDRLL